jgi:hypothetical protein
MIRTPDCPARKLIAVSTELLPPLGNTLQRVQIALTHAVYLRLLGGLSSAIYGCY